MGAKTGIEWTDSTWNPNRGCRRISPGCLNCYAEVIAGRFCGQGQAYEGFAERTQNGARWTGRVELLADALDAPLRWREGRRVFVNSTSDTFHEELTDHDIERVFAVMALAPRHTFQVLTKRADRMARWFNEPLPLETRELQVMRAAEHLGQRLWGEPGAPFVFDSRGSDAHLYWPTSKPTGKALANRRKWPGWPLPNVWVGVSVEDQARADERIPHLLSVPARVRFLSCEPLLGPLTIKGHLMAGPDPGACGSWVIAGGESGFNARPMHPSWVRSLREQCARAGVPFFFKQWGQWRPKLAAVAGEPEPIGKGGNWGTLREDGTWWPETTPWNGRQLEDSEDGGECVMVDVGKGAAGRELDGRTWDELPGASS